MEATNAAGANIQLMKDGDAEIAIAMQDAVMQTHTATDTFTIPLIKNVSY